MFKEIKDRDAWSTIRGYVYQVNHTIAKWLELREDEKLELEKGEDYDLVKNIIGPNLCSFFQLYLTKLGS